MKKHVDIEYECEVCNTKYDRKEDALACEASNPAKPDINLGSYYREQGYNKVAKAIGFARYACQDFEKPEHRWVVLFEQPLRNINHYLRNSPSAWPSKAESLVEVDLAETKVVNPLGERVITPTAPR